MAQDYARAFYHSREWQRCRTEYIKQAHGLCEVCRDKGLFVPGVIVHHINHISPENIHDPQVLTDFNNLQLVCRDCHAQLHRAETKRYKVDDLGRVIV